MDYKWETGRQLHRFNPDSVPVSLREHYELSIFNIPSSPAIPHHAAPIKDSSLRYNMLRMAMI
jgi:hypothetical protein